MFDSDHLLSLNSAGVFGSTTSYWTFSSQIGQLLPNDSCSGGMSNGSSGSTSDQGATGRSSDTNSRLLYQAQNVDCNLTYTIVCVAVK